MNTSPTPTTTTCPLVNETGTEIVSPTATATGSELTSISLDVEQANDDASASAVDASPKAKTMKEILLICGRGLAVSVVIALALAGKAFFSRAHNDLTGTDGMMMNADFSKDSSKQVALLDLEGDGNNVAGYDLTKVDGGVSTVRTLEQGQDPITYEFTKVGVGFCTDSTHNYFDYIVFYVIADVDECKTQCGECPGQGQAAGRELRGFSFTYLTDIGACYCFLDDGDSFSSSGSDCTGAGGGTQAPNPGTGAICNHTPGSGECWEVVDSTLQQCPTPAPTNEPTSSPSRSPTQTPSTAPTAPPTMAPTASPSTSMAPTASPTPPPTMAPTETPSKTPTAPPTAQPNSAPTKASAKSGKSGGGKKLW